MTVHWLDMFDGQVRLEPPVGELQLSAIPAKRGNALLLAQNDDPIVLLPAADMRSRVLARLREPSDELRRNLPDLMSITQAVLWKRSFSHFQTELDYFELARAIWPGRYLKMLAWKPAWFVHVNPADEFPHFKRTREVLADPGVYLGPFGDGESAESFIQVIADLFDLCRDYRCLVQSPNGRPCSYMQIGRCVGPCDGTMPLTEYRQLVARAAKFAAGDRAEFMDQLKAKMKQAAAELKFEAASAAKSRLQRMAELDRPGTQHVRAAEDFQYLLIQSGPSFRKAMIFMCDRGTMLPSMEIDFPLQLPQLEAALKTMHDSTASAKQVDDAARYRMGLVAHYLFSGQSKRGLILHWTKELSSGDLAQQINAQAELLHLRQPVPRKKPLKAQPAADESKPTEHSVE